SGRLGAEEGSRVLSAAAFYVFVPALLFRTTARIDFHRLDVRVVVAFFAPTLALVTVVYTALRIRARAGAAPAEPSVRAITSAFGNAVQIGIPLAAALFGEAGLALHPRRRAALADAADGAHRAGRARPRARASGRRRRQRAARSHARDDGAQHGDPSGRPASAGGPRLEPFRSRAARS